MTVNPLHTYTGESRSTVSLSGNGQQLPTLDQVTSHIRLQSGAVPGSDAVTNPSKYTMLKALGVLSGRAQGIPGVSDELIDGWLSGHNSTQLFQSNLDGFACSAPTGVGQCSGVSIQPAANQTNGIFRNTFSGRSNIACRLIGGFHQTTSLEGRRYYFGLGSLTTGSTTALTKGALGAGWGGFSDYVQLWDGTIWVDTSLRWKNETTVLQNNWDFQITSYLGNFTLEARPSSDTGSWTTLKTWANDGWLINSLAIANLAEGPTLSGSNSNSGLTIRRLHYASNR